jgi:hypothetical protein
MILQRKRKFNMTSNTTIQELSMDLNRLSISKSARLVVDHNRLSILKSALLVDHTITESISTYYPKMGNFSSRLWTDDEFNECLRHVIVTMRHLGLNLPENCATAIATTRIPSAAVSNMKGRRCGGTVTWMNKISIIPGVTPARTVFIMGHEMMHLWLLANGIKPPKQAFKEAVCNATGVVVFTAMMTRFREMNRSWGDRQDNLNRLRDETDLCYRQVHVCMRNAERCAPRQTKEEMVLPYVNTVVRPLLCGENDWVEYMVVCLKRALFKEPEKGDFIYRC